MDILNYIKNLKELYCEKKYIKQKKVRELRTLPFVYGLISISLSSGLSVEQSLRTVSDLIPKEFEAPVKNTIKEIDLGNTFSSSAHHMENNERLRSLAHVMLETYDLGNDSIWVIDSLNRDALHAIKRETDIAIKKLPITMLLPLVLCILPAFIFLSVLPILINGLISIDW